MKDTEHMTRAKSVEYQHTSIRRNKVKIKVGSVYVALVKSVYKQQRTYMVKIVV